jgi:hypothetical protein
VRTAIYSRGGASPQTSDMPHGLIGDNALGMQARRRGVAATSNLSAEKTDQPVTASLPSDNREMCGCMR